ncbi:MAG: acetyl-CoA carboxylase biotin carboxyl carrier protein subunit, partial [Candidatus Limnocylindrales bacterium]
DGEARIDTLEAIWPPSLSPDETWADETRADETQASGSPSALAWLAAARALAGGSHDGWRLNGPARIRLESEGIERTIALVEAPDRSGPSLSVAAVIGDANGADDANGAVDVDDDGRSIRFRIARPPDVDRAAQAAAAHRAGGRAEVTAPMPGRVLVVHVLAGTSVEPGAALVTLEAMKMEHVVTASAAGTVNEVLVRAGDQVTRGQHLVVIGPPDEPLPADALP